MAPRPKAEIHPLMPNVTAIAFISLRSRRSSRSFSIAAVSEFSRCFSSSCCVSATGRVRISFISFFSIPLLQNIRQNGTKIPIIPAMYTPFRHASGISGPQARPMSSIPVAATSAARNTPTPSQPILTAFFGISGVFPWAFRIPPSLFATASNPAKVNISSTTMAQKISQSRSVKSDISLLSVRPTGKGRCS